MTADSPATARAARYWRTAGLAVIAIVAAAALLTFRDYGLTWDEMFQAAYGEKIAAWFTSGFTNREALDYGNLRTYGGLADLLGWIAGRLAGSPSGEPVAGPFYYEARHLVTIAFGLLGLGATFRLASLVAGARAGALAVGALALTPLYYGHLFNNSKDIPFAALVACALCAIVVSARELPHVSRKSATLTAVALGAALGVRAGGVFLFGYLGLLWMVVLAWQWRSGLRVSAGDLARSVAVLALTSAAAWALMLVCWPWGQIAPISHPLEAIASASRFDFARVQRFLGEDVPTNPPPLSYVPVWLGIVLPEFHFVAWAAGAVSLVRAWRQRATTAASPCSRRSLEIGFIGFAVLFPPTLIVVLRSTIYDGARHLIFILPPLCALTGIALSAWVDDRRLPRLVRVGLLAAAALSAVATLVELPLLHPYEALYFNRLAGGLPGAAGRFETDYWGLSYREGMEWLIHHPPPSAQPLVVANCSAPFLSEYFLDKDPDAARYLHHVTRNDRHDVLLATTRWGCDKTAGDVLHIVSREGVPLLYVIRRNPPAAGTAAIQ